ncbi:hypothetical protein EBZ70_11330 [bacterium]|nr:hypothetical protein [bacterium]
MADFDFLEEFGVSAGEAEQPQTVYEKFILNVGNKVTADLREYIQKNAMNTGALAQSVVYFPTGTLSFEIQSDFYYKFVDEGVNGIGRNVGSDYSFKTPFVSYNMAKAIQEWKGLEMSHAFAVASNIKQRGLRPKKITESVITDETLEMIARDLAEVTGLTFEIKFEKTTDKWQ